MNTDITAYNLKLAATDRVICDKLFEIIAKGTPQAECKVWHGHPVWFIEGNPIVGYSKRKQDIRILFWSGQSFDEPRLISTGSFKAAEISIMSETDIDEPFIRQCLDTATRVQWDYKNIVKNRGILHRL